MLNNNNKNKLEPTWTYLNKLEDVRKSIVKVESNLNESIKDQKDIFLNIVSNIKSDVKTITNASVSKSEEICLSLASKLSDVERNLQIKMDSLDQEHNRKDIQLHNALNAYKKQVDTLHFDIIDNEDNLAINYINPNGKVESGYVKKIVPDNKTLTLDKDNKVSLKYKFNPKIFNINSENDEIKVTGLSLNNGKILDADRINNDLNNASYNISSLTYKLDNILKKISNINGYLASNNFKKSDPDQTQLTNFAIECLSQSNSKFTIDLIPAGTKIKNTFDNHIWVLNRLTQNGLTTHKWEDFGADNICIASNDGVHGLVAGSQDHFKVFVDVNGTMSINGLEEDFQLLLQSVSEITTQINNLQNNYENRIKTLELKLKQLEENA